MTRKLPALEPTPSTNDDDDSPTGYLRVEHSETLVDLPWVAANELPLEHALVAFLIARCGEPLDKFMLWVVNRRPHPWVRELAQALPLTPSVRDKLLEKASEANTSTLCTTPTTRRRQSNARPQR